VDRRETMSLLVGSLEYTWVDTYVDPGGYMGSMSMCSVCCFGFQSKTHETTPFDRENVEHGILDNVSHHRADDSIIVDVPRLYHYTFFFMIIKVEPEH
jgi:hypothetical protein